ncbi:MAG: DUF1499 domain-containing protein [Panacagrimonas sp.]
MKQLGTRLLETAILALICTALCACGIGSANLRKAGAGLAPCDGGPHCVSSEETAADRKVEPLRYAGKREDAWKRLEAVLKAMPRTKLVANTPDYVHAEVTTSIMRYVDDVEFVFATKEPRIDVRSSSRIGYYDFKANRERVDAIRAAFEKK